MARMPRNNTAKDCRSTKGHHSLSVLIAYDKKFSAIWYT